MASKKNTAPGCLIPFGLLFVVVGCIPGCMALRDLRTAHATRGWVETTAIVLEAEMRHGDETFAVHARYRYRAPDPSSLERALRDYESTEVGVHDGSDNVGDWQMETFARLDQARRAGTPVPCWYDPADPANAMLDRDERWELVGFMLIFPLVFGGAGLGIAWLGFHLWRKQRRPAPDPGILARQAEIAAGGTPVLGLWVAAILVNGIGWGVLALLLHKPGIPWWGLALFTLFPLIGLILLWSALRDTARTLRHGRPLLRLAGGTWTTGTRVAALLANAPAPLPGDRIEARLVVVRSVTSGSGKNRSTTEQTLWSLDLAVDPTAGRPAGGRWEHPLELPLPGDLPPADDTVAWRLEWHLDRPGPDLSATFTLPVVAGTDDGGLRALDLQVAADRAAPLAVLQRAGLRLAEEAGGVVLRAPAWRNPGMHLSGLIATLVLSVVAVSVFLEAAWWSAFISLPLLAVCWRGALRSATWRSTLVLARGRITVASGWWRIEHHELKTAEITEVERTTSMTSGDTAWYNMWLHTAEGVRIPIMRGLPGPAAARVAEMIEAVRR